LKPDSAPSDDVRLLSREYVFRGRLVDLRVDRVQLPGGEEATREVVEHPGAVAIVAVPRPGSAFLVRQHRQAVGGSLWEIPAGKLEPGEASLDCAKRELREETGLAAATWCEALTFFTTPGFSDERISLFVASGLRRVPAAPDVDVETCASFTAEDLGRMLKRGELADAKTILGLLWAGLLDASGARVRLDAFVP
jgi:ADP-ribose pyrophosphatase